MVLPTLYPYSYIFSFLIRNLNLFINHFPKNNGFYLAEHLNVIITLTLPALNSQSTRLHNIIDRYLFRENGFCFITINRSLRVLRHCSPNDKCIHLAEPNPDGTRVQLCAPARPLLVRDRRTAQAVRLVEARRGRRQSVARPIQGVRRGASDTAHLVLPLQPVLRLPLQGSWWQVVQLGSGWDNGVFIFVKQYNIIIIFHYGASHFTKIITVLCSPSTTIVIFQKFVEWQILSNVISRFSS